MLQPCYYTNIVCWHHNLLWFQQSINYFIRTWCHVQYSWLLTRFWFRLCLCLLWFWSVSRSQFYYIIFHVIDWSILIIHVIHLNDLISLFHNCIWGFILMLSCCFLLTQSWNFSFYLSGTEMTLFQLIVMHLCGFYYSVFTNLEILLFHYFVLSSFLLLNFLKT